MNIILRTERLKPLHPIQNWTRILSRKKQENAKDLCIVNEQMRNGSDKFEFSKWMGVKLWQWKSVVCTNYSWIEAKYYTSMIAIFLCELWWSHSEVIKSWFSFNFLTLFANARFYV